MNEDMYNTPVLLDLKMIHFDFEHGVFEINGVNVGHYTEMEISFQNGKWHVFLGVSADFAVNSKLQKNVAARCQKAATNC